MKYASSKERGSHLRYGWGNRMKPLQFGPQLIAIAALAMLVGCSSVRLLMPTPYANLSGDFDPYQHLNTALKRTEVRVFYITDRMPEQKDDGSIGYGYRRSSSLGFGTAVVDLGTNVSWEELVQASRTQRRLKPIQLSMGQVEEIVRAPGTPALFSMEDGKIVEDPEWFAKRDRAIQAFRKVLVQQLALTSRNEIIIGSSPD